MVFALEGKLLERKLAPEEILKTDVSLQCHVKLVVWGQLSHLALA